jgi:hypothetical protein
MRNRIINRIMKQSVPVAIFMLGFMLIACSQKNIAKPPTEGLMGLTTTSSNANVNMDQLVDNAVTDLAGRVEIATNAITVTQARTVQWRSSSVGCPVEGINYTQAIVPGVLLLLEADGKTYRYHARDGGAPFYCPDEQAEAPAYGAGEEFM